MRFYNHDFCAEIRKIQQDTVTDIAHVQFDVQDVMNIFKQTKARKSLGPYNISGQQIFHYILQLSLNQQKVSILWKHATIAPVC